MWQSLMRVLWKVLWEIWQRKKTTDKRKKDLPSNADTFLYPFACWPRKSDAVRRRRFVLWRKDARNVFLASDDPDQTLADQGTAGPGPKNCQFFVHRRRIISVAGSWRRKSILDRSGGQNEGKKLCQTKCKMFIWYKNAHKTETTFSLLECNLTITCKSQATEQDGRACSVVWKQMWCYTLTGSPWYLILSHTRHG